MCVCDLAWITGRAENLVSHHVRQLRSAGVAVSRRQGKMVLYRLTLPGAALLESISSLGRAAEAAAEREAAPAARAERSPAAEERPMLVTASKEWIARRAHVRSRAPWQESGRGRGSRLVRLGVAASCGATRYRSVLAAVMARGSPPGPPTRRGQPHRPAVLAPRSPRGVHRPRVPDPGHRCWCDGGRRRRDSGRTALSGSMVVGGWPVVRAAAPRFAGESST